MAETEEKTRDLQTIVAEIEMLQGRTMWQINPLIRAFKSFGRQPDLAIPLMIAGITRVAKDGQIYTSAKSEYCKKVLSVQKPFTPAMAVATKDLITRSAERLATSLKDSEYKMLEKDTKLRGELIDEKELVISDFAQTMQREQPEVRQVYAEWADYSTLPYIRAGYGKPWTDYRLSQVFKEVFGANSPQ